MDENVQFGRLSPKIPENPELRVDYGPGYRIYFSQRGESWVILLAGGDKRTQSRDIERALELARNIEE